MQTHGMKIKKNENLFYVTLKFYKWWFCFGFFFAETTVKGAVDDLDLVVKTLEVDCHMIDFTFIVTVLFLGSWCFLSKGSYFRLNLSRDMTSRFVTDMSIISSPNIKRGPTKLVKLHVCVHLSPTLSHPSAFYFLPQV